MFAPVLRSVFLAGAVLIAAGAVNSPAQAAEGECTQADSSAHRTCSLPINKSLVIDLPRDAHDVLVSNPGIADAVVRTARRIYLTGIALGETSIFIFDAAGGVILSLELNVGRDLSGVAETIARLIPGAAVQVEMVSDSIILSGRVHNAADSRRAQEIAEIFATGTGGSQTARIINLVTIEGEDQVFLSVTIAEIERDTVKQLGMSWGLNGATVGAATFSAVTASQFSNARGFGVGVGAIRAQLEALESTGLVHTLAEPTLTAISGEPASFLAGGEIPIGTSIDENGNAGIEYKPFGVSLAFTPVVLSEGRISLHVSTEVSEVSSIDGATGLPAFSTRRAETTLELPSGGSMVIGGLLQDSVRQVAEGVPGVRQLPILGALFGSRDYQRNETELVIVVTPYLVEPVARSQIALPTDGFAAPADASAIFLGQVNRQYGIQGDTGLRGSYQGNFGFIIQ